MTDPPAPTRRLLTDALLALFKQRQEFLLPTRSFIAWEYAFARHETAVENGYCDYHLVTKIGYYDCIIPPLSVSTQRWPITL